ncbi:hypothetical protein AcV5_001878 [Taiwanofungus camphoratus]|nr:hypothetical protein AcV5_001878 [Antrodia cinnamomea]
MCLAPIMIRSSRSENLLKWSLYVGFAFEVAVDSMITVSQCLLLRRLRTGIRSTDSAIIVLTIYSINTDMLTSICAILCLITYTVLPHMFVYFAFYFVLSKLYVNSLLANLNARGILLENIAPPSGQFNKMEISDSSARETSALQPARFSTFIDLSGIVTSANHAITVTEYSEPII